MGRRSRIQVVLVLIVGLLLAANVVSAHANLIRSEPAANSVLDTAPTRVRLWFSEVPEPGISQILVLDRAGKIIPGVGRVGIDPEDSKALSVTLPVLSISADTGLFRVMWISWFLLLGATIGGLIIQTADVGGNVGNNLLVLLTGTHYGLLFWLRLLVIVLIGVLLATRESPWWHAQ